MGAEQMHEGPARIGDDDPACTHRPHDVQHEVLLHPDSRPPAGEMTASLSRSKSREKKGGREKKGWTGTSKQAFGVVCFHAGSPKSENHRKIS
jgi:hypothetical protein